MNQIELWFGILVRKDWGRGLGCPKASNQSWVRRLLEEVRQQTLPKRNKERVNEPRRTRRRASKFPPLRGSRAAARIRAQKDAKSV
jgi:hypothetical protein